MAPSVRVGISHSTTGPSEEHKSHQGHYAKISTSFNGRLAKENESVVLEQLCNS